MGVSSAEYAAQNELSWMKFYIDISSLYFISKYLHLYFFFGILFFFSNQKHLFSKEHKHNKQYTYNYKQKDDSEWFESTIYWSLRIRNVDWQICI